MGSNEENTQEFKLPEKYQGKYNSLSEAYENYKKEHIDGGILKEKPYNFNIIGQIIDLYNGEHPENKTDMKYEEIVNYFAKNTSFEGYVNLLKKLIQLLENTEFSVSEGSKKLLLKDEKEFRGFEKNLVDLIICNIFLRDHKKDFIIFLNDQLKSIIEKQSMYEKFLNNGFMVTYTQWTVQLKHISFVGEDNTFSKNHFKEKTKIMSEDIQPSSIYFINMNEKQEIEKNVKDFLNLVNKKSRFKYDEFNEGVDAKAINSVFDNLLPRNTETAMLIKLIDEYSQIPKTDYKLKNKRVGKLIEISKEVEKLGLGDLKGHWFLDVIHEIAINKAKYLIAIDKIKELAFQRATKMPEKGSTVPVQNFRLETPKLLLTMDYTAEWLRDVDPAGRSVKFHQKNFSAWKWVYEDAIKRGTDKDFPGYFWWLEDERDSDGYLPELDFKQNLGASGKKLIIKEGVAYSDENPANYNNYIYALNEKGDLVVSRIQEDFHHDRLLKGANVVCAGHIYIKEGKITYIDNVSGHYQPKVYPHLMTALKMLDAFKVLDPKIIIKDEGKMLGNGITYEDFKALETIKMRPLCKPVTMPLIEIFLQKEKLTQEISLSNEQLNVMNKINIQEICSRYFGEFKVGKIKSIEEVQDQLWNLKKKEMYDKRNKLQKLERYNKTGPINEKEKSDYQQMQEEAANKIKRAYRESQTKKLEQKLEQKTEN